MSVPTVSDEAGGVRHAEQVVRNEIGFKVVGVGAADYDDSYVFKRPTVNTVHHILLQSEAPSNLYATSPSLKATLREVAQLTQNTHEPQSSTHPQWSSSATT